MGPPSVKFNIGAREVSLSLPVAASRCSASVFVVGLHKAGSTLLNRIMRPLCMAAGLTPFAFHAELQRLGIDPQDVSQEAQALFVPRGYAYLSFRGFSYPFPMPACASGRTVLLLRDPRDMIVSLYFSLAVSHAQPPDAKLLEPFDDVRQKVLNMSIDEFAIGRARFLLHNYEVLLHKLSSIEYRHWRYEDIIFDKLRWAKEMMDYLRLPIAEPQLRRVVEKNDIKPAREAVSEHIRKVTPGDHRQKLKPETILQLNQIFESVLQGYGYSA